MNAWKYLDNAERRVYYLDNFYGLDGENNLIRLPDIDLLDTACKRSPKSFV